MRRIAALGGLGLDQLAHARRHLIAGSLPDQQVLGLHTHKSIDQRQDHAHCDRCDVLEDLAALAGLLIAKPMFASSLSGHHCLVLSDGYYEWREVGVHKQPYRILLKTGEPSRWRHLRARADDTQNEPRHLQRTRRQAPPNAASIASAAARSSRLKR
jgi:hypothetical protein